MYFLTVIILVVVATGGIHPSDAAQTNCTCHHINANFNEIIKGEAHSTCRKCFKFTYDFTMSQNWTARVCVSSQVSHHTPILVVVREYLDVLSFLVPHAPEGKNSSFTDVCHTLCPLSNYFDEKLKASKQNIYVEISSQSENPADFEFSLSKLEDFIIATDEPMTFNVTPSQPYVLQYNMKEDINTVRVEVTSTDDSCMALAIQDIQCPFSDFESTMPHYSGFYQTLMRQSGITISREFFPLGRVYVVLILRTTNEECRQCCGSDENQSKEVTVKIVPPISGYNFSWGILAPLLFFLSFYILLGFYYCCCRNCSLPWIQDTLDSILFWLCPSSKDTSTVRRPRDVEQLSIEDSQYTKNVCFVSDLCKEDEDDLIKISNLYAWNLLTIAVFYFLPASQFVYYSQRIVYVTGNQDLCFYNFLCSHELWVFSDFNHFWSNIGYILLGLLFLIIVKCRESGYKCSVLKKCDRNEEITGICDFGLYKAMGLALVMEGCLSACYHVCPSQTNFQFDTTFMYVICVLSMLKIYQARHPDSTIKPHVAWIILAILLLISFFGGQFGPIVYLVILVSVDIAHLIGTCFAIFKIYFAECRNADMGCWEIIKKDLSNSKDSFKKHNWARFILLILIGVLNVVLVLWTAIKQESVPMCILFFLIGNLFLYLIYYIVMKVINGERIPWYSLIYFILSIILWAVAVKHFERKRAQWELTPAESREKNEHCIESLLDFYDDHDAWHFLSSIAIFFSILVPFTLDDLLEYTRRDMIIVF